MNGAETRGVSLIWGLDLVSFDFFSDHTDRLGGRLVESGSGRSNVCLALLARPSPPDLLLMVRRGRRDGSMGRLY